MCCVNDLIQGRYEYLYKYCTYKYLVLVQVTHDCSSPGTVLTVYCMILAGTLADIMSRTCTVVSMSYGTYQPVPDTSGKVRYIPVTSKFCTYKYQVPVLVPFNGLLF